MHADVQITYQTSSRSRVSMSSSAEFPVGVRQVRKSRLIIEKRIGGGTFSNVWLARDEITGEAYALKRCPLSVHDLERAKTLEDLSREIKIHQLLQKVRGNTTNINVMLNAFLTHAERGFHMVLNIMFALSEVGSLREFLPRLRIECAKVRNCALCEYFAADIFSGLATLHALSIAHRDLKPANILVHYGSVRAKQRFFLQLCDLGAAKQLPQPHTTPHIVSLPYRAPELLWGSTVYTTSIDLWSAGCVLAELYLGEPIFYPTSDGDMSLQVLEILGKPTDEQLASMQLPREIQIMLHHECANVPGFGVGKHLFLDPCDNQSCNGPSSNPATICESSDISSAQYCSAIDNRSQDAASASDAATDYMPMVPSEFMLQLMNRLIQYSPGQRPVSEDAIKHITKSMECGGIKD